MINQYKFDMIEIMKNNDTLPKKISIFPLSNFIIFPNTSVPLNIFEPRYIEMINDSMKNDRIIGMIQPKKQTKNKLDLFSVGCAGRITSFNETEDGRYLIVIKGLSRFKILKEINNNKLYREFEITFDDYKKEDMINNNNEIKFTDLKLIFNNLKYFFERKGYNINWKELEKQSLDQTINTLAMASPFSLEEKQILLEAKNLDVRKNRIAEILSTYTHDIYDNTTLQ